MMNSEISLITSHPLLNVSQAEHIVATLGQFETRFKKASNEISFLGDPYYVHFLSSTQKSEDVIKQHNEFMLKEFSWLIDLVKGFFKDYYGKDVFFDETISLPGFHKVACAPGVTENANFHFDLDYQKIAHRYPELRLKASPRCHPFTVLLTKSDALQTGLRFIKPELNVTQERIAQIGNQKLKSLSSSISYNCGRVYVHESMVAHDIYAENLSNDVIQRITLQGNVIETGDGRLLLYW